MDLEYRIDQFLMEKREEVIETLYRLCRINSVKGEAANGRPYGEGPALALDEAIKIANEKGFITTNEEYRCGSALTEEGRAELGVLGHLDIVPAGDGWTGDPFSPYIKDGFFIGRGVADDKGGVIVGLFAAEFLKRESLLKKHSVRLIFGCAEETGMDDLPCYLKYHSPPSFSLVPDSEFPVCCGEKGIYSGELYFPVGEELIEFSGGLSGATNVVAASADAMLKFLEGMSLDLPENITAEQGEGVIKLHATGIPAHASRPDGSKNAILLLARFISEHSLAGEATAKAMRAIEEILTGGYAERTPVAFLDEPSGKLTLVSGLSTLADGRLRLNLDIRYPVTDKGERVTAELERFAAAHGADFNFINDSAPYYHDKSGAVMQALTDVYERVAGERLEPFAMGGGTYARHMPNSATFGYTFPSDRDRLTKGVGGCHEPDECQSVEGLFKAIKIYILSLIELDRILD